MQWCLKSLASWLFTQLFIQVQIKKTSKLRVTGLCEGNSPVTGEFPTQRTSNAENVSIWWCLHVGINKEPFFVERFTLPSFTPCCTCFKISSVHLNFICWLHTIFSLQCLPRKLSSRNSFNHHHWQGRLWTHLSWEGDGRHQKWWLQEPCIQRNTGHFETFSAEMFWR